MRCATSGIFVTPPQAYHTSKNGQLVIGDVIYLRVCFVAPRQTGDPLVVPHNLACPDIRTSPR